MTVSSLKEARNAKPFRPFRLRLAGGEKVAVHHPETMLISPRGKTVVVATDDDAFKIIDVIMIVSIDVGNGAAKMGRK